MSHGAGNSKDGVKDAVIDFTAGSLGGIALVYVGQPLDTIKVKMQTFPNMYKGMVDCFKKTFKSSGIARGLYAGTLPAIAANVTENSVLFLFYGICQKFIVSVTSADHVHDLTTFSNASAGFLAAFFSSVAICPTELVKCKLQAMHEINKIEAAKGNKVEHIGPYKLVRKIFKQDGVRGFFRGLFPTLLREMPGYFFFFGGYEGTREFLRHPGQSKDDIGLWKTSVAGAVGGSVFWTLTYPVDAVKSRIQITNQRTYFFTAMHNIIKKEGALVLYSGLTPTLLRTVPATATLFVTVEYSKKFMHYITKDF